MKYNTKNGNKSIQNYENKNKKKNVCSCHETCVAGVQINAPVKLGRRDAGRPKDTPIHYATVAAATATATSLLQLILPPNEPKVVRVLCRD